MVWEDRQGRMGEGGSGVQNAYNTGSDRECPMTRDICMRMVLRGRCN